MPCGLAALGDDDVRRLARHAREPEQVVHALGTAPSNSSSSIFIVPRNDFAFWRKNPVARMSFSSSSGGTAR